VAAISVCVGYPLEQRPTLLPLSAHRLNAKDLRDKPLITEQNQSLAAEAQGRLDQVCLRDEARIIYNDRVEEVLLQTLRIWSWQAQEILVKHVLASI